MALLDILFYIALLFLGVQFLTLLSNLVFFPVLASRAPTRGAPTGFPEEHASPPNNQQPLDANSAPTGHAHSVHSCFAISPFPSVLSSKVSILVPARNEARNLPETLPRLLRQGALEVLVLDDGSTDGTAEVLRRFAKHPRLRVLTGKPLPKGWNGKNWACWQLAGAARGNMLIFTDADVLWEEEALGALLDFRSEHDADYLSVWPRQIAKTFMERLTVPLIDMVLLGGLPYLGVRYVRHPAFSAGNGQLMLFSREAYLRAGGHEAVKDKVLEDVHLGQRAKATGSRVALALGGRVLAARMYRGHDEVIAGFAKNLLAVHLNRPSILVLSLILNTLAYTLPYLLAFIDPNWLLLGALGLVQRALTCLKARRSPLEAPLQPFMAYPLWVIGLRALGRHGAYEWKGRRYEV